MPASEKDRGALGQTLRVQETQLFRAPDGSEIHELPRVAGGSMAHCRLPASAVTIRKCPVHLMSGPAFFGRLGPVRYIKQRAFRRGAGNE